MMVSEFQLLISPFLSLATGVGVLPQALSQVLSPEALAQVSPGPEMSIMVETRQEVSRLASLGYIWG